MTGGAGPEETLLLVLVGEVLFPPGALDLRGGGLGLYFLVVGLMEVVLDTEPSVGGLGLHDRW